MKENNIKMKLKTGIISGLVWREMEWEKLKFVPIRIPSWVVRGN